MLKLRSRRIHKRPFFTFLIVITVIVLIGSYFLMSMGAFGDVTDLLSVKLTQNEIGNPSFGIGINMTGLPVNNFIRNPSFENIEESVFYSVEGYDGKNVFVLPKPEYEKYMKDGVFTGGSMRVLAYNDQVYTRKLETIITDYKIHQPGLWNRTDLPTDRPSEITLKAMAASSNTTVAVGDMGYIVYDVLSATPTQVIWDFTENFVDCIAVADRFYALTENGTLAESSNGRSWNLIPNEVTTDTRYTALGYIDKTCIAVGENGTILRYMPEELRIIPIPFHGVLQDIAGNESVILIVGEDGSLYSGENGSVFRRLSDQESPEGNSSINWTNIVIRNNTFILGGSLGELALGNYSSVNKTFSFTSFYVRDEAGNRISVKSIDQGSEGIMLVLDDEGKLYRSSDYGISWTTVDISEVGRADLLHISDADAIVLSSGKVCHRMRLYTRISYESDQEPVDINRGDMLFLQLERETEANGESYNQWEIFGNTTQAMISDQVPTGGGRTSLVLKGTGTKDEEHILSQVIAPEGQKILKTWEFYRLDIWMKQTDIEDSSVMIWMTGNFEDIGTTFKNVGNGWRKYTHIFSIPGESEIMEKRAQRINIAFRGTGELYLDKVELRTNQSVDQVFDMQSFVEPIQIAGPNYIRLSNLKIGSGLSPDDSWYRGDGNDGLVISPDKTASISGITDITQSLQFVKDTGANPWLVMDSLTSLQDVRNLLAYLCGTFSDEYGALRIEAGKATPWSKDFDRIVFEIQDSHSIFSADVQKGAFVNYIKSEIESAFLTYRELREKVIFIDGMSYSGGVMMSSADFHAADVHADGILSTDKTADITRTAEEAYNIYYDQIPRVLTDPSLVGQESSWLTGEWIRSLQILLKSKTEEDTSPEKVTPISAAAYLYFLLYDMGINSMGILPDIPVDISAQAIADRDYLSLNSDSSVEGAMVLRLISIIKESITGIPMELIIPKEEETSSDLSPRTDQMRTVEGVKGFAYKNGETVSVIFMNLSDQTRLFHLDSDFTLRNAEFSQYSDTGLFLESSNLRRRQNRVNLLPGQFVIITIPVA